MTSVSFEEEKVCAQTAEEEEEGRKVLPGLLRFSLWFFFYSSGKFWNQPVRTARKVFSDRRVFVSRGGCQLQTTQTGSGRDMAVSSDFSLLTWSCRGFLSARRLLGSSGTTARLRSCSCKTPPNFRKKQSLGLFSRKRSQPAVALICDSMLTA